MKKIQILDGTMLKIIAVICMVFDHVGDALFPSQMWLRAIGRIAFPIFAFCVSEGYIHSKDRLTYLIRIGVFALISEIPFNLFVSGNLIHLDYQNVMFTFFIAILALVSYDKITENKKVMSYIIGIITVLLFAIVALIFGTDYGLYGVLLVFCFYVLKNINYSLKVFFSTLLQLLFNSVGVYIYTIFSFVPLLLYNGKKGKGLKWLFYVFYPSHLLLLYFLKVLIK